ncbi:hypothetical protein F4678DRAFT_145301 [Xylaria arbuscula]|nr:hypothetical protein F4678DRAFT_145301 [Xylaria arbuscula]
MDVPETGDTTYRAPSINHGAQAPASVAASRGVLDSSARASALSAFSMSPIAEIKRNAILPRHDMSIPKRPGKAVAAFIVSGDPDTIKGVVEAVYNDLKDGNKDAKIEFQETAGYIRVEAPTEEDALALIKTSQRLAANHLSGQSTAAKVIFVEPPTTCRTGDFRLSFNTIDEKKEIRAALLSLPDTQDLQLSSNRYKQEFSKSLCEAFETAASLSSSLVLRIHLGCYLLQYYRPNVSSLEAFESMIRHPKATGRWETHLGESPVNLSLEAAIRLVQAPDSPCVPIDNQMTTAAEVIPTYTLESWHDQDRYETDLEMIKPNKERINEPLRFNLVRTKMIPPSAEVSRFEAISLSLGRNIDWKIVCRPGDEKTRASRAVQQYLEKGKAELQGSRNDFCAYPTILLHGPPSMASKLGRLTIKSIYRFSWKGSEYVVQLAILRQWKTIHAMNTKGPPKTDFGVTIYAENWDQDSRVRAGETVAKIWGDELQGLLRAGTGDATGCAISRVQELIQTILDIRDFFESVSHV